MKNTLISAIKFAVLFSTASALTAHAVTGVDAIPLQVEQNKTTVAAPEDGSSKNVTPNSKIPWPLRDDDKLDTEEERQERMRVEKEHEQQRLQILAISTVILKNSKEIQKLTEKAKRETYFQDSIVAESLARNILFPAPTPPAPIDTKELFSLLSQPHRPTSETSVMLYRRVRDSVDEAAEAYCDYNKSSRQVQRCTSRLASFEKMIKENRPTADLEKESELDRWRETAKQDLQKATVKRSNARQHIVDLAGEGVAHGIDKQMKADDRLHH